MPAWVGPLQGMVEVRCLSRLVESAEDATTYTTGLSGRVRGRVTPQMSRSWSCSIDVTDPSELGTLEELIWARRGEALWLVTEAARVQNVLPPLAAELDRDRGVMVPVGWKEGNAQTTLTMGGAVSTEDGTAATSVLVAGGGQARAPFTPVLPGVPFTISCYASAGATVSVAWIGPDGVTSSVSAASPAVAAAGRRTHLTLTPAADQRVVQLRVNGATWFTRPQLTWTDAPVPWVRGKGAPAVHLGPLSEDVLMALTDGSRNLSSASYTIREVG